MSRAKHWGRCGLMSVVAYWNAQLTARQTRLPRCQGCGPQDAQSGRLAVFAGVSFFWAAGIFPKKRVPLVRLRLGKELGVPRRGGGEESDQGGLR